MCTWCVLVALIDGLLNLRPHPATKLCVCVLNICVFVFVYLLNMVYKWCVPLIDGLLNLTPHPATNFLS